MDPARRSGNVKSTLTTPFPDRSRRPPRGRRTGRPRQLIERLASVAEMTAIGGTACDIWTGSATTVPAASPIGRRRVPLTARPRAGLPSLPVPARLSHTLARLGPRSWG